LKNFITQLFPTIIERFHYFQLDSNNIEKFHYFHLDAKNIEKISLFIFLITENFQYSTCHLIMYKFPILLDLKNTGKFHYSPLH
jgi:hypothetical protein